MPLQRIRIRRDTKILWELNNPVLSEGEFGFEKDTYKIKIGHGGIAWNDLPYFGGLNEIHLADIELWPPAVTVTEIGYLEGVTSNIQTQINTHTHDIGTLLGGGAVDGQVAMWDGTKWAPATLEIEQPAWIKQEFEFGDTVTLTGIPHGPVLWFKNGLLTQTGEDLSIAVGDMLTAVYNVA